MITANENEAGDDHGDNEGGNCDSSSLTQGTLVKEAEAKATADGLVYEKVELIG